MERMPVFFHTNQLDGFTVLQVTWRKILPFSAPLNPASSIFLSVLLMLLFNGVLGSA